MKEKKTIIIALVILLLAIVATIGASYAYFATVNKTSGNDKKLNITTEDLGSIKWEGAKVFTSDNLLPGECGVHAFTIEKNSPTGKGVYEIDLKGVIDESFGDDVEITLYKSIDTTTNNVTIKEGTSTISGDTTKQYYKEDSVVINGTPEKVYGTSVLQNDERIKLEQADFDNSTLLKTTYYLVYCYKNNGNQDHQQGKSFSGEISVRLILDKNGPDLKASSIDEWKSVIPINISMQDNKSGLKEYQISDVDEIPSTWKSISGNNVEVTEEVTSNKIYYIYAKNQLDNISRTSINITKVDNIGPAVDFDVTTGNGTAVVDASKSVDNESGIAKYEYSIDNGTYYSSSAISYNFTNLSHGSHTFSVRITDIAGNVNTTTKTANVIVTYTVTYDANGGSGAPGSQTKTHDTNLTLSNTKPTKTGYTFLGWSTRSTGGVVYNAGGTYSANAGVTLYAVWQVNTYTITYNANGGSGAPGGQRYTYATSGSINLSSTKPTRTGYTFLGWSLSSSATGASYSAGQAWNRSNASNYTLYAVWRVNTYTITYNANGGSGAPGSQSYTYATSGAINLSSTRPTRTNYSFLGWSTSSSATSASYSAGQAWNRNNASNYTLYAVWRLANLSSATASGLNIGNDSWQGAAHSESKAIGPYDLTGINKIIFNVTAKTRNDNGNERYTQSTLGVSANKSSFTRSATHEFVSSEGTSGWGGYTQTLNITVNVSGLSGNYYLMQEAYIYSYNWSNVNSIQFVS